MKTALGFALAFLLSAPLAAQCVNINRGVRDTEDVVVVSVSFADNTPQGDRAGLTGRIIEGVQQWNDTDCQKASDGHAYPRFARPGDAGTGEAPILEVVYHEGPNPRNDVGCGDYNPNVPHIMHLYETAYLNNLPYSCNVVLEDNAAHEAGHELGLHHPSDCADHTLIMQPVYYPPGQRTPVDRSIDPAECEEANEQNRTKTERDQLPTYTLRGSAVWPQDSYFSSVTLTAEFATLVGGGSNEVLNVTSMQTEFAFSTPLEDGTTYRVVPTVPDDLDCFLGPDTGTVSGGDPPGLQLFCLRKIPSFCERYPRACFEATNNDPHYPDFVPWYTAYFCQPQDRVDYGAVVPCVNPTTGVLTGATCTGVTVTSVLVCQPCLTCLKASAVTIGGPTVSLWAPLGGATVTGRMAVRGSAVHPSGTMDGVRVWVDDQPVSLLSYETGLYAPSACADQPADCNPYAGFQGFLETAGLTEGAHTLMVISVEDSDDTPGTTILRQAFAVDHTPPPSDSTPPTVSLSAPASGALVNGTVVIAANASDNVGVTKVEFYVDGALKGTDTTSPFATSWNTTTVGDGTHSLKAKAYDSHPNVTTSAAVTVTVDNTSPRMYVESPYSGALVWGSSTRIGGWATDASRVTALSFKVDGQPLTLNSPYSYGGSRPDVCNVFPGDPNCPAVGWETYFNSMTLTDGAHWLQVVATDGVGLTTAGDVTFTVDNRPFSSPAMHIDHPLDGVSVSGAAVNLEGWALDAQRIANLTFELDAAPLVLNAPYSTVSRADACAAYGNVDPACPNVGWRTSFDSRLYADGVHMLSVVATDRRGEQSRFNRSIRIGNAPGSIESRFPVVADSYIVENYPTSNFGAAEALWVRGSEDGAHATKYAFLRFSVTNLTSPVRSARLRIRTSGSTIGALKVYNVFSSDWSETGLTWSNAPWSSSFMMWAYSLAPYTWCELDVTAAVTGNGWVTIGLGSADGVDRGFSSAQSTYPAELVVYH